MTRCYLYSCRLWHASCLPHRDAPRQAEGLCPQSPPKCSTAACPQGIYPPELPGTHCASLSRGTRDHPLARSPPGPRVPAAGCRPRSGSATPFPRCAEGRAGRSGSSLWCAPLYPPPSSRPQAARSPFPLPSARSARQDSSLSTASRRSCRHSPAGTPRRSPVSRPLYGHEEPLCSAVAEQRALSMVPRAACGGCCWAAAASRAACCRPPAPRPPPPPTLPTAAAPRGECGPRPSRRAAACPARPSRREGRRHRLVFCRCCGAPGCQHGGARDGREREGWRQPLPGLVPRYSVLDAVTWVRSGHGGGCGRGTPCPGGCRVPWHSSPGPDMLWAGNSPDLRCLFFRGHWPRSCCSSSGRSRGCDRCRTPGGSPGLPGCPRCPHSTQVSSAGLGGPGYGQHFCFPTAHISPAAVRS